MAKGNYVLLHHFGECFDPTKLPYARSYHRSPKNFELEMLGIALGPFVT